MTGSEAATSELRVGAVTVVDTFAEAFPMTGTRLIITAANSRWAMTAASVFCGYATSVIACDLEAAVERVLEADQTPDGRPGVSLLAFGFSRDRLSKAIVNRVGQCILTCPTTACYSGLAAAADRRIPMGDQLRYFGDGFQSSKVIGSRRLWRIPVMDGEFLCEDRIGTTKAVGGGNLLIGGVDQQATLLAAEAAASAIRTLTDVALPFPGGIVRSGSKVGSRYAGLVASTNEAYCPTITATVTSRLPAEVRAVYELVIDGLSVEAVAAAMKTGFAAAVASAGVVWLSAGNYGGKLGPFHFALRDCLP